MHASLLLSNHNWKNLFFPTKIIILRTSVDLGEGKNKVFENQKCICVSERKRRRWDQQASGDETPAKKKSSSWDQAEVEIVVFLWTIL